jgi:hypothetical protein
MSSYCSNANDMYMNMSVSGHGCLVMPVNDNCCSELACIMCALSSSMTDSSSSGPELAAAVALGVIACSSMS